MKPSDQLHKLVHSLTKTEKKHFRIFASRYERKGGKGKKNYIQLFEALDNMVVYDEQRLRATLADASWIPRLAAEKRHLIELLERFLQQFYMNRTVEGQLRGMLETAEHLLSRKIFDRCKKLLRKIRELATSYDVLSALLEVNQIERKLVKEQNLKEIQPLIEALIKEKDGILRDMEMEQVFLDLYDRISILMRREYQVADTTSASPLSGFMNSPEFQGKLTPPTFHSRRFLLLSKTLAFHLIGDLEQEELAFQDLLELWKDHPHQIREHQQLFKLSLANFLTFCFKKPRYDLVPNLLDQLKGLRAKTLNEEGEDFQCITFYEFLFHLNQCEFDLAANMVPTIEKGLEVHAIKVNEARRLAFLINIVILFLIQADYAQALFYLEKLFVRIKSDHRKDLRRFALLLEPALYYGKGDSETALNKIRASLEKLKRSQSISASELGFLSGLRKAIHAAPDETAAYFQDLHQSMLNWQKEGQANLPGYTDLMCWVEAKALGTSMVELKKNPT